MLCRVGAGQIDVAVLQVAVPAAQSHLDLGQIHGQTLGSSVGESAPLRLALFALYKTTHREDRHPPPLHVTYLDAGD